MDISKLLEQGLSHQQKGEFPQAKEAYEQALEAAPDHPEAFFHMGTLALQTGHLEHGVQYLIRAVNSGGTRADLFSNLAAAFRAQNNAPDMHRVLERGLELHPENELILTMLGALLRALGQHERAFELLERAISVAPQNADAHLEMARLSVTIGKNDRADEAFRQSIALVPSVVAHNEYGAFLTRISREEEAIEQYRAALKLAPDTGSILVNMGFHLYTLGRTDEAIDAFDKAIMIEPDNPDAHALKAFPLLLKGDYARGWKKYEWRFKTSTFPPSPVSPTSPQWCGEALDGKSILLIAEQGFGDTFQFVRYGALLSERGARVIVAAQHPGVELLKSAPGVDLVVTFEDELPAHDYHIHMMSLPERFATTLKTLPAQVPYLTPLPDQTQQWRERLASYDGLKVGIVWSGNPDQRNNPKRSCPLSALAPLAQVDGVTLFSLAKDRDLGEGDLHPGMVDLGPELNTFSDTAAIMANLDLVISVCTSAAHLSGALGRPTWLMLAAASDWRWGLDGDDCPWYPTARLFRQENLHDWPALTARIATALSDLAANGAP